MDVEFLLIRKMKQGDEAAFDVFVRKYYDDILKYCRNHCADIRSAEDLAQETFVHFFAKFSDYHYRGKTKNYLYTIAGNLCKNHLKQTREIPMENEILLQEMEASNDLAEQVTNRFAVEWALKQLPKELREVAQLYYMKEMKQHEIAKMLDIGLPLVKYRLRKAKEKLQILLREEEVAHGTRPASKQDSGQYSERTKSDVRRGSASKNH